MLEDSKCEVTEEYQQTGDETTDHVVDLSFDSEKIQILRLKDFSMS